MNIPQSNVSRFMFEDTRFSWFWLIVRLYIGYEWFVAGWTKLFNPAWIGPNAGAAVKGFLMGALQKTSGAHPDVSGWYAYFIQHIAIPQSVALSYLVTFGEILVGIALILGIFTGISAFFGAFMNINYLFAGTVSLNPVMLLLQVFLVLAWRTAGWIGLDHYVLPAIGTPWQSGPILKKKK